jgi:hypothetical protein
MVAALILLFGIGIASAATAINVTCAELNGTQLRVEGSGAVPTRP